MGASSPLMSLDSVAALAEGLLPVSHVIPPAGTPSPVAISFVAVAYLASS